MDFDKPQCKNCRFFRDTTQQCRRESPTITAPQMTHAGSWPRTMPGEWCGRYEPVTLTVCVPRERITTHPTGTVTIDPPKRKEIQPGDLVNVHIDGDTMIAEGKAEPSEVEPLQEWDSIDLDELEILGEAAQVADLDAPIELRPKGSTMSVDMIADGQILVDQDGQEYVLGDSRHWGEDFGQEPEPEPEPAEPAKAQGPKLKPISFFAPDLSERPDFGELVSKLGAIIPTSSDASTEIDFDAETIAVKLKDAKLATKPAGNRISFVLPYALGGVPVVLPAPGLHRLATSWEATQDGIAVHIDIEQIA